MAAATTCKAIETMSSSTTGRHVCGRLRAFDLTGGLRGVPGAGVPRGSLIRNPPDGIEGVHASMLRGGAAESWLRDRHLQASRLKLDEWEALPTTTVEINTKAARDFGPRRAAGEQRFVAGRSDRPLPGPPPTTPRFRGRFRSAELVEIFAAQAAGLGSDGGGRTPADHRDRQGHPRGLKGAVFRRHRSRRFFGSTGRRAFPIQQPRSLAVPNGGQDAPGKTGQSRRCCATLVGRFGVGRDFGLNCSTGPEEHARTRSASRVSNWPPFRLRGIPNAGLAPAGPRRRGRSPGGRPELDGGKEALARSLER